MEPKDFVGVFCRCAFADTQAKQESDSENAHEEAYSIEVIQVEFIQACCAGIPMHAMSGTQNWIIKLVSFYEKYNPVKIQNCTWRIKDPINVLLHKSLAKEKDIAELFLLIFE